MHVNKICLSKYVYTLHYTQATEQRSVTNSYCISLELLHFPLQHTSLILQISSCSFLRNVVHIMWPISHKRALQAIHIGKRRKLQTDTHTIHPASFCGLCIVYWYFNVKTVSFFLLNYAYHMSESTTKSDNTGFALWHVQIHNKLVKLWIFFRQDSFNKVSTHCTTSTFAVQSKNTKKQGGGGNKIWTSTHLPSWIWIHDLRSSGPRSFTP
jgi:hypothetical protein